MRTGETPSLSGRTLIPPDSKTQHASADAREESQLVGSARAMLRAGNATVALQLLDRATSRYPQGVLVQEREALRVEALTALGRTGEALTRAQAFMAAYPKSPHLRRIKASLEALDEQWALAFA